MAMQNHQRATDNPHREISVPGHDTGRASPNRLVHETSPYLRQHADNPVDWFPWGAEAFAEARRTDRPIFLSVGYSTCHWCHVMARESFEDAELASLLNRLYVPVKVDREERPDIDQIYILVTQMLTGQAGWPNSVWLTPEGQPFFAGTYFPPEGRGPMPGFRQILTNLASAWKNRRKEVEAQAGQIMDRLRDHADIQAAPEEENAELADRAVQSFHGMFDETHGGFGGAPKFPPHTALRFLLTRPVDSRAKEMAVRTLSAMARGGIRDHLGGGFHRYSVDERWFVPHFEKMLYDNAQLLRSYAEAHALTGRAEFATVARETADWMARELISPAGGLYSALDADSEGKEGAFYLWSTAEVRRILGDEADGFIRTYGLTDEGNFLDPVTGRREGNILFQAGDIVDAQHDAACRARLLDARQHRPRPHRDEKVLTSWNGLAIGALARAGKILHEGALLDAAAKAAEFLLDTLRVDGRLLHCYSKGVAAVAGHLDDHAFLGEGLLDLWEATREDRWLAEARRLADEIIERFADPNGVGFFYTPHDTASRSIRLKDITDQSVPSAGGVAVLLLARLAESTGSETYRGLAHSTLHGLGGYLREAPTATVSLLTALPLVLDTKPPEDEEVAGRSTTAQSYISPLRVEVLRVEAESETTSSDSETLRVTIHINSEEGWHVAANERSPRLEVSTEGAELIGISWPAPERFFTPAGESEGYHGALQCEALLRTSNSRNPLRLDVSLQPCHDTDGICAPPRTHPLVISGPTDS